MINKKIAVIVTAENKLNLDYYNNDNFFVIGVERGCLNLIEKKIKIDLAISNFDQVLDSELELIKSNAKQFIMLDDKEKLDGISAIDWAKKNGYETIKYICEPTQRMDMNLSILEIMNNYDGITIYNEKSQIEKLKPGKNELKFLTYQDYSLVSFLSLENDNVVSIRQMKHEITDYKLKQFDTRLYSNSFLNYTDADIRNSKPLLVLMTK